MTPSACSNHSKQEKAMVVVVTDRSKMSGWVFVIFINTITSQNDVSEIHTGGLVYITGGYTGGKQLSISTLSHVIKV